VTKGSVPLIGFVQGVVLGHGAKWAMALGLACLSRLEQFAARWLRGQGYEFLALDLEYPFAVPVGESGRGLEGRLQRVGEVDRHRGQAICRPVLDRSKVLDQPGAGGIGAGGLQCTDGEQSAYVPGLTDVVGRSGVIIKVMASFLGRRYRASARRVRRVCV
jgi:hypothetical protein